MKEVRKKIKRKREREKEEKQTSIDKEKEIKKKKRKRGGRETEIPPYLTNRERVIQAATASQRRPPLHTKLHYM